MSLRLTHSVYLASWNIHKTHVVFNEAIQSIPADRTPISSKRKPETQLQDHFLPEEWIDRHHPIDDIEPDLKRTDAIRDARVKCVILLNAGYSHIESALLTPGANVQDIAVSFYQSAYALGLNLCAGISMTERADKWGVERASISKGATKFCEGNALPPSFYMKKEEAKSSYCDARVLSIEKENCKRKIVSNVKTAKCDADMIKKREEGHINAI